MNKMVKKTEQMDAWQVIGHRLKEALFILLAATAIFLSMVLITYQASDPGWSHTAIGSEVQNSGGLLGAWVADMLLFVFGYFCYLYPPIIMAMGLLLFRTPQLNEQILTVWCLRLSSFLCVIVSGCLLMTLHVAPTSVFDTVQFATGGLIGSQLAIKLTPLLGFWGTSVVAGAIFLISITIGTGLSWIKCLLWGLQQVRLQNAKMLLQFVRHRLRAIKLLMRLRLGRNPLESRFIKPIIQVTDQTVTQLKAYRTKRADIHRLPEKPIEPKLSTENLPVDAEVPVNAPKACLPEVTLLSEAPKNKEQDEALQKALAMLGQLVIQCLQEFGIEVSVEAVSPGPVVSCFELALAPGLKASKITSLSKDLARSLSVPSVRVVEVIPGKSVIGLEIPNQTRETVYLRDILESKGYTDASSVLTIALGQDIVGNPVIANVAQMPHLLVAGTTGSGKSVGINAMLLSLLYKATPEQVRLLLIDPKMLELSVYEGIGHLLTPVVTDMQDAANALKWCIAEMERRYQLMAAVGVRHLSGYNEKIKQAEQPIPDPTWQAMNPEETAPILETLPAIVVIIDEFADMMMVVGKKVEELIARLAQKARAAGIHLILATQRPSVDVITGLIKANIPTRIAFQVSSRIDSRTILDQSGAEQLLGHGDMLYLPPGTGTPIRVHGAYVSDQEVHSVVHSIKARFAAPNYIEACIQSEAEAYANAEGQDPLYDEAVTCILEAGKASISLLQRRLKIGYNRAACLMEIMEQSGLVSEMQNGVREILVNPNQ